MKISSTNLNACTNHNPGEEISSNHTRHSHHQALDACQCGEQHEDEIRVVAEPWMQVHQKVNKGSGCNCNEEEEWER